jgi:hypothetical protein
MNIIFYATLLITFLELCLFIKFKLLQFRIKTLAGTGRQRDIEVAYNWKMFVSILLVTIPLISAYVYF